MVALLELLHDHGMLSLTTIADQLGASVATIRRDVAELAGQGLVERTHGGCRPTRLGRSELPVRFRDGRQAEAKRAIAALVAAEIPPGRHAIALTGGSTTAAVLRALKDRDDLTIITNSISVGLEAAELEQRRVLIAGGVLRPSSLELVGSLTEQTMQLIHVDTAIVGADGCTVDHGITTHDETEARTNHLMIERARRVVVAIDSSKLGQVTPAPILPLAQVDVLITDDHAPAQEIEALRAAGVDVLVASA
ncbi:DeoR/GlpR family DNA-binding transcription regulator [uncultured Tessaracoccus sp.]|uniref:DeoR/GlpR family DNA-binding transcription regulator n=1 Tax=uncultured Tessaracoccus sp. TaxID=905023 RepID=UPI0025E2449F|nr:DeoR/GlpR family DNA-binding transcription regulator [uncultured Tessaracoccus sp.]